MPNYTVTMGRDEAGQPRKSNVKADSFAVKDGFIAFKVGSVVIKAIREWQVETIDMEDPPKAKPTEG